LAVAPPDAAGLAAPALPELPALAEAALPPAPAELPDPPPLLQAAIAVTNAAQIATDSILRCACLP
jgi:hypothetical protein